MSIKEPLRSIRWISVRPRHLCQVKLLPRPFFRSHNTTTVLQPSTTVEIIPNQAIHLQPISRLWKPPLTIKDYEKHMSCQDWLKITKLFEDAKSANLDPSHSMYMSTLKAYGYLGNSKQVTRIFKEYKKRHRLKSSTYQHYIQAILNCNDLTLAHKIFLDVKSNPKLTAKEASICLSELIAACNIHHNPVLALKAAEELYQSTLIRDWDTNALNKITKALWTSHVQLLNMPDTSMTSITLEQLVLKYMDNIPSKPRLAMLLELSSKRTEPTVHTCNLVLETQSKEKDYAGMKFIMGLMQKLNIDPDHETVSILLRTFGSSLPVDEAERLYDSLKHNSSVGKAFIEIFAANPTSSIQAHQVVSDIKMDMDTASFMILAEGFVKRNEIEQGFRWLRESDCKDLDSYAVLMEGLLNRGEWSRCVSLYETICSEFEQTNVDMNHRIIKCMLAAQFSQKNTEFCDHYLSTQLKFKFTPNTIIRILNTLLSIEDERGNTLVSGYKVIKALKVLESRLHVYLDAEGISKIIIRLSERGDCAAGYQLYKWIRENGHEISRERCGHGKIYKALMSSATKNNDPRILERVWVDMQYRKHFFGKCIKEIHNLSGYNLLLNGYASQLPRPNLTRVKKIFKQMLSHQLEPDLVTYNILIKAFVNSNNMTAAKKIYNKMLNDSNILPDARTTNTLLHGWIVQRDWAQVESFVQDLKNQSHGQLDIVTFNLLVQSFLQLDSKSMSYEHLLKNQHRWDALKDFTAKQDKQKMSSDTIWNIFESSTGYSKSTVNSSRRICIDLCHKLCNLDTEPSQNQKAFVKLFSTEANQVTYKLFMKAFVNIGDYESASKINEWMEQRLSL